MENNLALWNRVDKTDPAFTKNVSYGRKYTAIDPQYQLKNATREWGPYGATWGLRDLQYSEIETPPYADNKPASTEVRLVAEFFYPDGSFPIVASQRLKPDDDVYIKVFTHARSKALSLLGFNSDIYEGKYEDVKYVQQAKGISEAMESLRGKAAAAINVATTNEKIQDIRAKATERYRRNEIDDILHQDIQLMCNERERKLNADPKN